MLFHRGKQSISPLRIRVNLEHGFGSIDHPTGVVVALRSWESSQPAIVLDLHFMGGRSGEPVFGVRFEILGVTHPAKIVKLMTCRSGDCATVGGPAWESRELGKDVEFFAVFLPFLEMLSNHPPAVVEYLGEVFVRTKELGNVLLEEVPIIVLFEPAVELWTVSIEVGVAVELIHIQSQGLAGLCFDSSQFLIGIGEGFFCFGGRRLVNLTAEDSSGESVMEFNFDFELGRRYRFGELGDIVVISLNA